MFSGGKKLALALCTFVVAVLVVSCSTKSSTESTAGTAPPGTASGQLSTSSSATKANAQPAKFDMLEPVQQEDMQHLEFKFGPIKIEPGQNNITYTNPGQAIPKPAVDGYITAIYPNLIREDGSVPPVDVIHLHHGVWLNLSEKDPTSPRLPQRFFASGEEKTTAVLPPGYGYPYKATDNWLINYMLHNLLETPDRVWITYAMDFIPADSPGGKKIKPAYPIWMDVQNGSIYPVFDVLKNSGKDGLYTYPDDAMDPYKGKPLNEWKADKDMVLLSTAGHLHPGGLHTDLYVTREGATGSPEAAGSVQGNKAHLFRSETNYYEPAGAVSWDVAMTATRNDWMVRINKGDVLSTTATYDTSRGSWYESMGIMVIFATDVTDATPGRDPFKTPVDATGVLTHGHLAENDNHGGEPSTKFVDMTKLPNGPATDTVTIADFAYGPGDMSGIYNDVPIVKPGGTLRFDNKIDAPKGPAGIWHTVTACKAPCNGATGVAYPLADADVSFDSGELGNAGPPTAGRLDWTVPTDLQPGTYTYFCRIHPSMRGAFRVSNGNTGDPAPAG